MTKSQLKQLIRECIVETLGKVVNVDMSKVHDLEIDGVDTHDYPDFSDAYISAGVIEITKEEFSTTPKELKPFQAKNGKYYRDLTDTELDWINDNEGELINTMAHDSLHESKIKLSEITKQILAEEAENPVVRNIAAKENFDDFMEKSENKGESFSKEENNVVDVLETKPSKKENNKITYSSTDNVTKKNKELVVIKKQKKYIAYFSERMPVNVTPEEPTEPATEESPEIGRAHV